ncbi:hypothetical protein TNCV_4657881 [Trichonephila clavipes]|nr:hypothetical protein TNCV_4657881 [Trichonephila clavipes]
MGIEHSKVAAVAEWYGYLTVSVFVWVWGSVHVKSVDETSSRWCGVVVRRGVPARVSSIDHGSKLRGPSPKPSCS